VTDLWLSEVSPGMRTVVDGTVEGNCRGGRRAAEISVASITRDLDTAIVARNVLSYGRVGSTNDVATRLAREGTQDGTLVIAEEQTSGRGRMARRWYAPAGSSLLMSLVCYPPLLPSQIQRVTMVCSLGARAGIELVTGLEVELKWPNDVVIRDKKVAGLLAEASVSGRGVSFVVVGIGINVNLDPTALADVLTPPTSLSHELDRSVDRNEVLRSVLRETDRRYVRLLTGWSPRDEWASHLVTLGRVVTLIQGDTEFSGVAEDVDEDGVLLLRDDQGLLHRLPVGDVTSHHPGLPPAP
jgi:BirA family biotin operon repressor/biotin-[acetyl-CoA-carboxylase] ligase